MRIAQRFQRWEMWTNRASPGGTTDALTHTLYSPWGNHRSRQKTIHEARSSSYPGGGNKSWVSIAQPNSATVTAIPTAMRETLRV